MEQTIKPLTSLEHAAQSHSVGIFCNDEHKSHTTDLLCKNSFKAGAKWQKDEDKEILKALSTVYNEYMQSTKKGGRVPDTVTVTINFQTMQHVATILNKHL